MEPRPGDLSGRPRGDVAVPAALGFLADPVPVWMNQLGGLTFSGTLDGEPVFAKWQSTGVADEVARLEWALRYTPVPEVLVSGDDVLVTRALPAENAVSDRWLANPAVTVAALGSGLRALHDALPVKDCPFDWSVASRLERAGMQPFADLPPVDRFVVCHGDPCPPNTLIAHDGTWLAHLDLGRLGVADRWADIAVGVMSLEWNYGPGWGDAYLAAYGVAPDPERMAFYRELWNRTP